MFSPKKKGLNGCVEMAQDMQTQPDYVSSIDSSDAENAQSSLWERWKAMAARAASFQARILLTIFYWICVTPFAVCVKLFADPLGMKKDGRGGSWQPVHTSDKARAQF
ncbi:MAG: hypothetical protein ACI38Q_01170 [Candidatus Bruticola sp.]